MTVEEDDVVEKASTDPSPQPKIRPVHTDRPVSRIKADKLIIVGPIPYQHANDIDPVQVKHRQRICQEL